MSCLLPVLLPTPAHSRIAGPLLYRSEVQLAPGTLVRVPLGRNELLGVVWESATEPLAQGVDAQKLRPISAVLDDIDALGADWCRLITFSASYYQRSVGEVALAALPGQLRDLNPVQLKRRLKRCQPVLCTDPAAADAAAPVTAVALSQEQQAVLAAFHAARGPFLLFGATGSGKTEIYLQGVAQLLAADASAQALVLVPEINLTPQLERRFRERFDRLYGASAVVCMHSGMTAPQRLQSWLAAHNGSARIVLGTRMAIFASMPQLKLIVVDEEHDPSYKSSEGARYSARDLAVYRGQLSAAKVILGSATPSLESWYQSRAQGGRYQRLEMPSRIGSRTGTGAMLAQVRRVDMNHQARGCIIAPALLQAIVQRIERGEQSLILLNRRGYAPVLHCLDCGWKSACPHCSAYRVFHKIDRTLRCHHCGFAERVPRACPVCSNPDIAALGQGTERLEEQLAELLKDVRRPNSVSALKPQGEPVQIMRIDADSSKRKGVLESQLAQVHSGAVDLLVGTQMVAKGHDFRRITLVAVIGADSALFSSDFRAPERLFGLLLQAAGRAGRDADIASQSEMWLQTAYPQHPLFEALKQHDYPGFAAQQLKEREQAGMPPFGFQALLRAEARSQQAAHDFLNAAKGAAADLPQSQSVTLYPAVPLGIARVANVERAQMLIESHSRAALQRFLTAWQIVLHGEPLRPFAKGLIRWAVDVDPLLI